MADWVGIAREYLHFRGSMSSFYRALCEAIIRADKDNLERLKKGFPELCKFLKDGDLP
jgi:hypothetical protein